MLHCKRLRISPIKELQTRYISVRRSHGRACILWLVELELNPNGGMVGPSVLRVMDLSTS